LAPAFQAPRRRRRRLAPVYSDSDAKILLDSYYGGSRNAVNAEARRFCHASTMASDNDAKHDVEMRNHFLIMNWRKNYHITLF
jgi:hypothetical protein